QVLKYHGSNRVVFEKYPITDSLIKGEMLALRAFIHFDLMRLFGKGNLGNRPELKTAMSIPYVTDFTRKPKEQLSNAETIALLRKDIEEAIKYLEVDPLSRLHPSSYFTQESSA